MKDSCPVSIRDRNESLFSSFEFSEWLPMILSRWFVAIFRDDCTYSCVFVKLLIFPPAFIRAKKTIHHFQFTRQKISKIVMFKRIGYSHRALGVEARIGDTETPSDYGMKRISVNRKCGATSSTSTSEEFAIFFCDPPLHGRFLSLQAMEPMQLNIGEVNVFVKGMFSQKFCEKDCNFVWNT